jgi:alpha-L-rhamnosidase
MKKYSVILLLLVFNLSAHAAKVENLRCEYLKNPLGNDVSAPRLSWGITSDKRGDFQQSYQLIVSSSPENLAKDQGDVWNTGKIDSDQSIQVEYHGKPLLSGTTYYWKVRIWDMNGVASDWSKPAFWSMGLLTKSDWGNAQWIAFKNEEQWKKEWKNHKSSELDNLKPMHWPNNSWPWLTGKDSTIFTLYDMPNPKYDPSPLFRKEFSVNKKVRSAKLYICGLGYYEAFLNGRKVGDHVLDPAWTNYDQRSLYVTYDVTKQLNQGENAIGVMLGRGQYNPLCNDIWGLSKSSWIDEPKLIAKLLIEYTDGTQSTVITDNSWKTSGGPIVFDDTRQGELYDARLEQKGWNSTGFNESTWKNASVVTWNARLESQMMSPIRCFSPLLPVKTYNKGKGKTVYDIGKNIAGWARVTVHGKPGARVLVEYCETPSDSELVHNLTLSRFKFNIKDKDYASFYDKGVNVRQQNGYILNGKGEETFECHFSYKGFQFIRIIAEDGVTVDKIAGIPVHTDVEIVGNFTCSNPMINQIQQNSVNSLLNNYHSIATDCPHREKQGWTADNYLSAEAAMYNFNMATFSSKWITDLAGTQSVVGGLGSVAPSTNYDINASTVWPAAIVFIPWNLYGFYNDTRVMEKNYQVMTRFAKSSLLRQVKGKPEIINDVLADWLAPIVPLTDTARNNTMPPPEGMTLYGTASQYLIVKRLSDISKILGMPAEAQAMNDWGKRIAINFNQEFFNGETNTYHGDKPTTYRQSANIVPLEYGLVEQDKKAQVLDNLIQDIHSKNDHLNTGFLGISALMNFLPETNPDLAYRIVTQKSYPSWGYMVEQGATSMWEGWDGYDSRNHTPFCLVSAYFYKYLAGIQIDTSAPGFSHFIINPSIVGDLTFVDAWHDSMYGRIKCNWKRDNGKLTMEVSIPVNTTATIYVPAKSAFGITESGKPAGKATGVEFSGIENGKAIFKVKSGNYSFQSDIN